MYQATLVWVLLGLGPFLDRLQSNGDHGNSLPSHPLPFRLCSGPWRLTVLQAPKKQSFWVGWVFLQIWTFSSPSFEPREDVWQWHLRSVLWVSEHFGAEQEGCLCLHGSTPPCKLASCALLRPAHLVGLPRPMGCLQGFVQPLRHQHQEASHPVQGLCTVDLGFRNDRLGLGSAVGREGKGMLGMPPGDISSAKEKNLYPECKAKYTSDKRKQRKEELRKADLFSKGSYQKIKL